MNPASPAQQALVALIAARGGGQKGAKTPAPAPLPPALRPWQAAFGEMAVEHVAVIARLMAELQPLIEEPEHAVAKPRGELEAYDGIATKGEMDRLLASQWLWRDLHEPEFLRRLAENELVFHHIRQRDPSQERAIGVVIDAGPWMLGRPRLVALAALLCLGRRAHAAGMTLFWRANGASGMHAWQQGVDRDNIRHFLTEVSAVDLEAGQLRAWLAAPPTSPDSIDMPAKSRKTGRPLEMQWYVVAPRRHDPALLPDGVTQILVAEQPGFDAEGRFGVDAEVTLETPAGRRRSLVLPLPDEAAATALLREPFPPAPVLKSRPSPPVPADDFKWAQRYLAAESGGRRLLVAVEGGVLVLRPSFPVPALFLPIRPHEVLLGLFLKEDTLVALSRHPAAGHDKLIAEAYSDAGPPRQLFELYLPANHPLGQGRFPPNVLPMMGRPGCKSMFWVYAPSGQPFEVSGRGVRPCSMLAHSTIVKVLCDHVLVRHTNRRFFSMRPLTANRSVVRFETDLPADMVIGSDDIVCDLAMRTLAIRRDERTWTVFSAGTNLDTASIVLGPGERLVEIEDPSNDRVEDGEYWYCGIEADGRFFFDGYGRSYPMDIDDFQFDIPVAVPERNRTIFAEHRGEAFATRVLTFTGFDGEPAIMSIAGLLAEAPCLRD